MVINSLSRRGVWELGGGALAGVALAATGSARAGQLVDPTSDEAVVRRYFKAWQIKDWAPFDRILADDFTFTSANDDDHISKTAFKKECWDTQIDFIKDFDLEDLMSADGAVFVKYLCHTKNGKEFRNVEYHRVRDHRIVSIECYFGGKSTFASAVASTKS